MTVFTAIMPAAPATFTGTPATIKVAAAATAATITAHEYAHHNSRPHQAWPGNPWSTPGTQAINSSYGPLQ